MSIYVKFAFALIAGVLLGGIINMMFVMIGPVVIAPPAGVDMSSAESMRANAELLQPKHYLFPLIAHAAGTFCGALVAYKLVDQYKSIAAYVIAAVFFLGGITAIRMIPAPLDYILVDLIFAYFPMAYAAIKTLEEPPARQGSRFRP